jgi:hypothetical protein
MTEERYRREDAGYLTLSWLAGEVQVDLGKADLGIRGVDTWGKYLTVTSPPQRCARQNLLEQDFRARLPGLSNVFKFTRKQSCVHRTR